MKPSVGIAYAVLALALTTTTGLADESPHSEEQFRLLSWNISGDAFISEQQVFESMLRWANPDIVLLDEVAPSAGAADLAKSLAAIRGGEEDNWTINVGVSGGRQRCVVASRAPQESLPEFSAVIPYPDADLRYLVARMSPREREYANYGMDGGIPVNGAIILAGGKRLLAIIADLQCCGDDQDSWQEYRRRTEARVIRRLVHQILEREQVDAILIAGDFNLVNGPMPLTVLSGPYGPGHGALISAEVFQPDGVSSWTWDGRQTPFPSGTLDFQIYGPLGLEMRSGLILDTEKLAPETLEQVGLESESSRRTGRHRPLVVEYEWQ